MTGITHKQAGRYLRAAADGLIRENQRALLDAHLRDCASCRAEADELTALEARLKKNFQARWDAYNGPSKNMIATIHSRSWRIIMTDRINVGFRTLAGIVALVVLGFAINYVISQLRNAFIATAATGTQLTGDATSAFSSQTDRLIAFVSEKDGNPDIYTMHADGSGWTNLTNDPANDLNPVWSPDGTRIAFESNRSGFKQIFVMMADGTTVIQLTDDEADHELNVNDGGNYGPWSPDGKKLIFSQKVSGEEIETLYTMDANGENKKPLVNEAGIYYFPSWSPDGKYIAFVILDHLGDNVNGRIYVTDSNGNNLTDIMKTLPADESLDHWNYSWSGDAQSISFIASRSVPGIENESNKIDIWNAYEASLDGNTLITNVTTRSPIAGYRQGTYFTIQSSAITWVSVKEGKVLAAYPLRNCQELPDGSGGYSYKESSNGEVVIIAYCPNGDIWLFWANSKGTVFFPLIDSPIHAVPEITGSDFAWSPDDKFIAFNIASADKTDMYILNVSESLKDPSIQLVQVNDGGGSLSYSLTWQPMVFSK